VGTSGGTAETSVVLLFFLSGEFRYVRPCSGTPFWSRELWLMGDTCGVVWEYWTLFLLCNMFGLLVGSCF